ncbi:MAG: hypothetical protein DMG76_23870 [Acidobacteria bacterium]|nr:MAG: hypothetical protein DMG76_23870 [Acidobacteriota bacterium]
MTSTWRVLLFPIVMMSLFQPAYAQQAQTVTLAEPGIIRLEKLFQMADTVALVKVLSGDTQNYPKVIYKAEVVKTFKGATVGQTIYFGPYVGTRLGWEYVLFLRNAAKPLAPNPTSSVNYGTVYYSEVFNEGYSSMETSYECVFDGKDIAQKCGDGVRVCTDYIKLPKSLHASPPMTEDTAFGCRWVS